MFACRRPVLVLGALLICALQGCVFNDAVTTLDYQAPVVAINAPEDGAEFNPLTSYEYLSVTARDDRQLRSLSVFCNDSLYATTPSGYINQILDIVGLAALGDSAVIRAVAIDAAGHEAVHSVLIRFVADSELAGPAPLAPLDGSTILRSPGEVELTLSIAASPSFAYYDWQVSRDAAFTAPTEYATQGRAYCDVSIAEPGRFHWRARGRATNGAVTRWSPARTCDIFPGTACSPTLEAFSSVDRIEPGAGSAFHALGQDGLGLSLGLAGPDCALSWQTRLTSLAATYPHDACALPDGRLLVIGNGSSGYGVSPYLFFLDAAGSATGPVILDTSQPIAAVSPAGDGGYFCGFRQDINYPYTTDFVAKLDASAEVVQWRIPAAAADCARLAATDGDTCCLYLGQLGQQDFSVGKVTIGGQTLWTRAFNLDGVSDRDHMALCALPDRGCVFGGSLTLGYQGESIFAARLGADGTFVWQSQLTASGDWTLVALAPLPDGTVLGAGSLQVGNNTDISVVKFSPSGQLLWSRTYGAIDRGEAATDIALVDGTVVLSGYQGYYSDVQSVVLKLDLDGNVLIDD